MSETYEIYTPHGSILDVNKKTNEIYFDKSSKPTGKYTQEYSKALFEADRILKNSPYKDYQPRYLDPNLYTGQSSTLLEFKDWQSIYLKDPIKGAIAPWTKAEKAYYKSLKTKRERYKYLVIRSGLRSTVIDIPYEAYTNVDEKGNLINEDYKELYKKVESNRGLAHLSNGYLFMSEWELAAGILGDIKGFIGALQLSMTGFKARTQAINFLLIQLGHEQGLKSLYDSYAYRGLVDGIHKNPLKAQMLKDFSKNPPYDDFGMLPFLDELIGVDWIIDLTEYEFADDADGKAIRSLDDDVLKGKLKDPRDIDSTPESRKEFNREMWAYRRGAVAFYNTDIPNDWTKKEAKLYMNSLILEAKLAVFTPPQGYPNAPYYWIPEHLEYVYKKHKLDKLLDPRIPAIYRYNFPEDLRAKIQAYAKEHNIKE
ncbi:hypothetical protein CSUB8523_1059 [Campylobacter subantarcticus LMG 24377]|uniref:hypothetical protein n=1 Tax=Campylobacter subantarcticus TaxID=497724 RepID=UPI000581E231|nr:hypothetical protein [Campylobacter subantarcticus]AJC92569.1 hypothetical protein CSUB8523_1059 [Campylobacter subantarcticus LMG 24377]EAL3939783.1 hypothetical protein [Campylobacter lari]